MDMASAMDSLGLADHEESSLVKRAAWWLTVRTKKVTKVPQPSGQVHVVVWAGD